MCGIFAVLSWLQKYDPQYFKQYLALIAHRGPEQQWLGEIANTQDTQLIFGFQRLCINGLSEGDGFPLYLEDNKLIVICNGEIFNYKELIQKYNFEYHTGNDCEIILHLYKKFGIERTVHELDGEFALILADIRDENNPLLFHARDPIGVRPSFYGSSIIKNQQGESREILTGLCSELKGLHQICEQIRPFPPGHLLQVNLKDLSFSIQKWFDFDIEFETPFIKNQETITPEILQKVNQLLDQAVDKRLHNSDRPIGLFISGGLDSSLISGISSRKFPNLHSFSIGLEGMEPPDLVFARKVAQYLQTKHHEVRFTIQEGIDAIKQVIWHLESFDVTTVRASTPMFLLSKWIKQNTDITVLLTGEAPDEIIGGYLYFNYAPSPQEFQEETERRVKELYMYDVLRSDRTTAGHALEVRVPFLDKRFLNFMINLHPKIKDPKFNKGVEKFVLRQAFDTPENPYIPSEVLWRTKEAFSDGVGYSWKDQLIKHVEAQVTDQEFEQVQQKYPHATPLTKEGYWYRKIFEEYYPGREKVIAALWMPKWIDTKKIKDPSATVLSVHQEKFQTKENES